MEWYQIQCFLAAAQEENFSRGAQRMKTSQPSFSQTIKRLEEELGYPLFEREGKRIHLNESGRVFLQTANQMNVLLRNAQMKMEELNNIGHPEVSIYLSAASTLLPQLILYLKERTPQIRYRVHQWKSKNEESEDDIQILAGPIRNKHYFKVSKKNAPYIDLEHILADEDEILFEEELHLVLPKNHPLAFKKQIFISDLAEEELIGLNDSWEIGRIVQQEMSKYLFTPNFTMLVDNPNMVRELLQAKLGIAFAPATSWHSFAGEDLVLRHVTDFNLNRLVYLHTKPMKYLTKEQKECIKGIKEFFRMKYMEFMEE